MPRPVPANSAPSLPILQKAPIPTEQLTQIQRRLGHLLNSLAELQGHIANAQTLEEWPSLLSRHLALASQTSSLTTFLSHASTNAFNTQVSQFNEALTNEALHNNKFASTSAEGANGTQGVSTTKEDALFAGTKRETTEGKEFSHTLLNIQYHDENNPLRRIVPHPFFPMESEKSQVILPALLLPKADDAVNHEQEELWKSWARDNGQSENRAGVKDHLAALRVVRDQIRKHDEISGEAIRSFIHAKEATDELGQRYDWKIRLDSNEQSEEEDQGDAKEAMEEDEASGMSDRKRKREEEETLTLDQVSKLLTNGQV